ncbi:competence type IV pilus minor pilin ComGF [Sporosarcina sp. G11-34]|uniref:competence type IV pilus minor pilin ComGF n=1 Tax=Sporosarcina sp. G11-34 TaxID=2849605 RepID=UPI0022A9B64F|nr:competence type IV pilus minor pilin ComGF [Sporosarcina sp. G11-34]MCZ2260082.1 ComGF family competence protein [Sporosarcina sp. G11-34]
MSRLLNHRDEKGYTFVESLFQLIILTVFVQFIVLFFLWKASIEQQYTNMAVVDWELFAADFQQNLSDVEQLAIHPTGRGVQFVNSRGVIDIEQGNAVIRKRVDGKGHVPLLTNIRSATFSLEGTTLYAYVTLIDGSQKERGFAVGLYPE